SANNALVLRPLPPPNQPPCEHECPANLDINRYMLQAARGYFEDAYRSLKIQLAFPGVIGRVCPHPCEAQCNRGKFEENQDKAISINGTKRFISDYVMENGLPEYLKLQALPEKVAVTRKEKVAVVGAGPAGLSAAYFLAKKGYAVTVFEALPVAGGMMAVGVPEHRLPRKVVNWEIDNIKKMGVTIKTNSPVSDVEALKKEGYKAVFVAAGLQNSMKLNVPGEDAKGVLQAVSFLRDVNLGKKVSVGKNVLVVGGGSVAMDVAMTVKRLGAASVKTVCLECSYEEMPAERDETSQAEEEGVVIDMSWGPKEILVKGGKVVGVELKRCTSCYDKSGKFAPKYDETETMKVDCDMVITAIGQTSNLNFVAAGTKLKTSKRGTCEVDARSFATNVPGIFAGGDILGAGLMIKAMTDGRNAAVAIDCYLQGKDLPPAPPAPPLADITSTPFAFHVREEAKEQRYVPVYTPVAERKGKKEINLGFADKETCIKEARRCLTCRCTSIRY
ncbi:MAG TPA: FAD-dependent oxidoreductase, partial [Dehalococcoidales bacterium]|nr:FAD-dependent oxidoreductase [Dehalococcoidales bacterium]